MSRIPLPSLSFSLPLCCAAVAAALPAQANRVVPAVRTATEGNISLDVPFWYDAGRVQLVIAGSAVANTAASLTGFAFRPTGADTAGHPQRTLQNVVISAGHAPAGVTPTTMSTTFTANHGTGFTTMFRGQLVLPAQPGFQSPAPFNIGFVFQQPFPYQRQSGDLVLEVEMPGPYTQNLFYASIDAEMYRARQGAMSHYGSAGTLAAGGRPGIETFVDGSSVVPGGVLRTTVRAGGPYQVLVWLGTSNRSFAGVAIPFDLTPFGAPGNHLLASMDALVATALQPAGSSWSVHIDWPIPATADTVGATAFAQAALVDTQANSLGLVFTAGLKVVVSPGSARAVEHSMLYHHEPTFPVGWFPVLTIGQGPAAGGPIVELRGRFQ
jgi:hypothetical protein